ncbi:hypothetical protein IFM89_000750 [Coptis chinensis]|uniref:Serine-threonine/tyrosine-protein kinase catalytic domain-containing protein n=1 Tax=Coptis chinensis TaxID=261450 RepID=A0A835MGV4_9MAGN|nr:hypothetical protein IFM89_000750 [Coptis chinensis]
MLFSFLPITVVEERVNIFSTVELINLINFSYSGYMDPEYAMHGQFSVKSDVFSFGVLILEIISGQKNKCFFQSEHAENLLSYAWKHLEGGTALELIEPALKDQYSRTEVMWCIHIGLLCVQEDIALRPTMATVVSMLCHPPITFNARIFC